MESQERQASEIVALKEKLADAAMNCPSCGRHDYGLFAGEIAEDRKHKARAEKAEAALAEVRSVNAGLAERLKWAATTFRIYERAYRQEGNSGKAASNARWAEYCERARTAPEQAMESLPPLAQVQRPVREAVEAYEAHSAMQGGFTLRGYGEASPAQRENMCRELTDAAKQEPVPKVCDVCKGERTLGIAGGVCLKCKGTGEAKAVCGENDWFSPRKCTKPQGHDGTHHDDARCAKYGGCPGCAGEAQESRDEAVTNGQSESPGAGAAELGPGTASTPIAESVMTAGKDRHQSTEGEPAQKQRGNADEAEERDVVKSEAGLPLSSDVVTISRERLIALEALAAWVYYERPPIGRADWDTAQLLLSKLEAAESEAKRDA